MRVTFVLPHAGMAGGIRVLAIYADRLHRRGHEVTVVLIPPVSRSFLGKLKLLACGRGWPREEKSSYFNGARVPHRVLELARSVLDDDVPDADVVLATFWKTGPWVEALLPSKGAKAILLQGYETSPGLWDPLIDAVWRSPLHKIVIAKWMMDLARDRFGDSNVHLVPNSVDTEQFNSPPRGKNAIPTVGILYSTPLFKGVDVALAALQKAKKEVPALRVVAFGAERVSAELSLPNWTEFYYRPEQNEIPKLYSRCDAWLCGSRQEGIPPPATRGDGLQVSSRLHPRRRTNGHCRGRDQWILVDVEDYAGRTVS